MTETIKLTKEQQHFKATAESYGLDVTVEDIYGMVQVRVSHHEPGVLTNSYLVSLTSHEGSGSRRRHTAFACRHNIFNGESGTVTITRAFARLGMLGRMAAEARQTLTA